MRIYLFLLYSPCVRKKAAMCVQKFLHDDPSLYKDFEMELFIILRNSDPIVTTAGLYILKDLIPTNPMYFKKYVFAITWILDQILDKHIEEENYYNLIPMPFTIILILRIFAILGKGDITTSKLLYKSLRKVMTFCGHEEYIGVAILYEWIKTIVLIYPEKNLIESACKHTKSLFVSKNPQIHYVAVSSLSALVRRFKEYAVLFHEPIVACLEEKDDTVHTKTYQILFDMCNTKNFQFIMKNILKAIHSCFDVDVKNKMILNAVDVAERFAPNSKMYIATLSSLLYYVNGKIEDSITAPIIDILKDGIGDDDLTHDLRLETLDIYEKIANNSLEKPSESGIANLSIYIFGEYGDLNIDKIDIYEDLMLNLYNLHYNNIEVVKTTLTAFTKLYIKTNKIPDDIREIAEREKYSFNVEVSFRCDLLINILTASENDDTLCGNVFIECDQVLDVDKNLHFLDSYVTDALENGALPYRSDLPEKPKKERQNKYHLVMNAYQTPTIAPSIKVSAIFGKPVINFNGNTIQTLESIMPPPSSPIGIFIFIINSISKS